jgi:hypothetical protein
MSSRRTLGSKHELSPLRRRAFYTLAAVMSLLVGLGYVGLTALTIGRWLARENLFTTPVIDLAFFALGAVIIGGGLSAQLRAPERHVAALQQALIGLATFALCGAVDARIEPFVGGLFLLAVAVLLALLHPARGEVFAVHPAWSRPLLMLAATAAIPAIVQAVTLLALARTSGPSCFFGQCPLGDRYAEMAALALAIALVALLAAATPKGRRFAAWSAGVSASLVGGVSLLLPELSASLGLVGGALAVIWSVLVIAVAELAREPRLHGGRLREASAA